MHLIRFRVVPSIIIVSVLAIIMGTCNTNNLCSKHYDCPGSDLCFAEEDTEKFPFGNIGGCMDAEHVHYDKDTEILKNIRHCSEDADCDDCSGDRAEEWGCLDKGGTIHNCMLKRDGKFQDPIIKDLWKKCEKK